MAAVEPGIRGGEYASVPTAAGGRASVDAREKKTAEIIQQEVSREVEHLLRLPFCQPRQSAGLDLEAVEMRRGRRSGNDPALAAIPPST